MGTHSKIYDDADPGTGQWQVHHDVVNLGSSGSVAVVNKNGTPVAIGVLCGVIYGNDTPGSENIIFFYPLYADTVLGKKK